MRLAGQIEIPHRLAEADLITPKPESVHRRPTSDGAVSVFLDRDGLGLSLWFDGRETLAF
jgi:hypothetical protein